MKEENEKASKQASNSYTVSYQIPVWIDCGSGHDDAIAILMASNLPSWFNLVGVSTVHGNAHLERSTANALSLLEAFRVDDHSSDSPFFDIISLSPSSEKASKDVTKGYSKDSSKSASKSTLNKKPALLAVSRPEEAGAETSSPAVVDDASKTKSMHTQSRITSTQHNSQNSGKSHSFNNPGTSHDSYYSRNPGASPVISNTSSTFSKNEKPPLPSLSTNFTNTYSQSYSKNSSYSNPNSYSNSYFRSNFNPSSYSNFNPNSSSNSNSKNTDSVSHLSILASNSAANSAAAALSAAEALFKKRNMPVQVFAGANRPILGTRAGSAEKETGNVLEIDDEKIHCERIHGESGLEGTNILPAPKKKAIWSKAEVAAAMSLSAKNDNTNGNDNDNGQMPKSYSGGRNENEESAAVAGMAEAVKRYPGEIAIVATGALTNIAEFAARYKHLIPQVRVLSIMGGAFEAEGEAGAEGGVGGNITPFAEFNIWCDPEAAKHVLSTKRKVEKEVTDPVTGEIVKAVVEEKVPNLFTKKTVLIPLNMTHKAIATKAIRENILSLGIGAPLDESLKKVLKESFKESLKDDELKNISPEDKKKNISEKNHIEVSSRQHEPEVVQRGNTDESATTVESVEINKINENDTTTNNDHENGKYKADDTTTTPLTSPESSSAASSLSSPIAPAAPATTNYVRRMIYELLEFFSTTYEQQFGSKFAAGPPVHHPLALVALLPLYFPGGGPPSLEMKCTEYSIDVITSRDPDPLDGKVHVGQTLAVAEDSDYGVRVVKAMNMEVFWELVLQSLDVLDQKILRAHEQETDEDKFGEDFDEEELEEDEIHGL